MGAPAGNEFWKLRSKHGRDKLFATPEDMWEAACEYFQWCVDNPLIAVEIYGKDAQECHVPKMRAFTYQGLAMYLDTNTAYFAEFKRNNTNKDFSSVLSRIEDVIYRQKFEGASAGFLNANIIARDLGLADKKDVDTSHSISEESEKIISDLIDRLNGEV